MSTRFTKLLTAVTLLGAPAGALASPRVLASGAPACGNTMGKGGYTDDCTAEEREAVRAEQDRRRERVVRHERAHRAAAEARATRELLRRELRRAALAGAESVAELARLTVDPLRRLRS